MVIYGKGAFFGLYCLLDRCILLSDPGFESMKKGAHP